MHKPMKHQDDYIRALVETRRQTDIFAKKLKPRSNAQQPTIKVDQPKSLF